ncbi:MAG: murJ, partial [Thermoleophilia bacterium]|nr:murJ [Thermoleophilia bacterium]
LPLEEYEKVSPQQVTFVGIGAIGLPMASQLLRGGYAVTGVDPVVSQHERARSAEVSPVASIAEAPPASTVVVMVATLATKFVGLVRESMASSLFGVGSIASAFTVAFQIPNVIRTFVADQALVGSLVPAFTELREQGEEERAWRVASTIVSILLMILIPLTLLAMVAGNFFVDAVVYDNFSQSTQDLAVELFRILIPIVMFMSIGGVIIAILNSHGRFGPPAAAQLAFNAVSVIVLIALTPHIHGQHDRVFLYSWSIFAATLVQALLPVPWLRGHGQRLRLGGAFRDPLVKAVLVAMLPVMLSLAAMNLNNIVNTYWSSRIPLDQLRGVADSGPSVIYRAWGVFQLPQGIFSLAVATVFFPLFARHAARNDMGGFREAATASIRQIVVLLMPATLFLVVLSHPIVRLLFEHGECDADCGFLVSGALKGFAVGLISNGAIQLLMRAFFSLRTPWTPAVIGLFANLCGNIVLGGLFHRSLGVFGVGFAMGLANTLSFFVMWFVLRRRLGGMSMTPILVALLVAGLAAALSVGLGWLGWEGVTRGIGDGLLAQLVAMVVAIAITWGLYSALALRLRLVNVPQLRAVLNRRR